MKLIDKDAVLAEIESKIKSMEECFNGKFPMSQSVKETEQDKGKLAAYKSICSFIDTLEVTEVDFWHKQSEEDIDDSIIGWSMHSFICLMKDGTTQEFTGIQDESYEGSISKHLDCVDDNYEWEYDDIVYWIEIPMIKAQKGE